MRSLIKRSQACRDSGTDKRDQQRDQRAAEYLGELKERCTSSRWNLLEVDFSDRRRKLSPREE